MSIDRERGFDETELEKRAKQGDAEAFDQLVATHSPKLYRTIRRMVPDASEAEAIIQETWLRVWRVFPRYQTDRPMRPWLIKIAINVARDRWRKKKPLNFVDIHGEENAFPDSGLSPEERMTRKQALAQLARGVETLRPEYRAVIALRYDAELSYQEIANSMGIPINTVRTHLRRAKAILRDWMEAEDE